MNRLKNTRCYLVGCMDRAKDGGVGWRQYIQKELSDLDIHWLDPTNKPIDIGLEDEESRKRRHAAKRLGDWDTVVREMRIIRRVDLRMVDIADFVIVHIDLDVHAAGTYEELFLANREKKPILVCIAQGREHCPDWLYGTLPKQLIFDNWDELIKYARHVAHDQVVDTLGRWYFFDFVGQQ